MEKSQTSTGETEGEEQDEPSSSSMREQVQNAAHDLDSFRARWKQEIYSQPAIKEQVGGIKPFVPNEEHTESEDIAKALFLKGIDLERSGKLYEAIQCYKKAVQLVPDIEFKLDYRPKPTVTEVEDNEFEEVENTNESDSSDNDEVIEDGQLLSRIQKKMAKAGYLCAPKSEQSGTHISALPLELILEILKWVVSSDLDLRSLEMFGAVCRGFYLCSRDPEIWRLVCIRIWGLHCNPNPDLYGSWRNMFIERPRLNFNGCYISKTTYIRHGENSFQDQFYRPWHLVAYYRYLRFFPEGTVLMLTSADDPAACVNLLKTRRPRTPVMIGYYRLNDDKVTLVVERQELQKGAQSTYKKNSRRREIDLSEQTFHMELQIQTQKNRRHAKLAWSYYSVFTKSKQGHESTCNFDLLTNRFPPLWFSRVKSFAAESDQPLN
ncbi:F-box only protein 9 [Anthonomus grandis grandis]|uniref:F-box only protein 9 n=1 Tax=Anthonomus grandis grandis TaxID=2921223 RepID=UPI0021651825|nr:F-box only protein 9 [Anthonomus grandis grandis]